MPQADPQTALIYEAAALCSTYVFRLIGALIFGWLSDKYRKKINYNDNYFTLLMAIVGNLQLMIQ
ncbi:hypothetical protein FLA4_07780 [Candidatus Rickettsia kotlanii]|nr:hypothetical protein FLA4_07780 [Candidatus Rickettsia kotlanii]BDU61611.1 hypothetical protein HM2_07790 [Candidatus Rickettsia kotlanii]